MKAITAVPACVVAGLLAVPVASAKSLPFTTIARGTAAPDDAALRPEAFVSTDSRFVYVYAYGGRSSTLDHRISISSVGTARGGLVVRATWGTPEIPFIVHPGEAVPYQFVRIRRTAIHGSIPRTALLVQVQTGLRPHTQPGGLLSRVANAATRLRSATLIDRFQPVQWAGGSGWFTHPTWFLSVDGNAACGPRNASTGYYLVDDATGQMFGCGIP